MSGDMVFQAAAAADAAYPMTYPDRVPGQQYHSGDEYAWMWHKTPTAIVGDLRTRLWYVYLSDAEQSNYPGDTWKRVWVKL